MNSYGLLILAVACLAGGVVEGSADKDQSSNDPNGNLKDTGTGSIGAIKGSDKLKRDLSIVGPIPSRYRGQARGQTTFDGIQEGDLQLPSVDTSGFGRDQNTGPVQGYKGVQQLTRSSIPSTFGQFSLESASDVYNFDGKEPVTYDGILASDLMVPLPHISRVTSNQNPAQLATPGIGQQYRQQVTRQANTVVDDVFPGDLTLPSEFTVKQVFSTPDIPESLTDSRPQLRDALFSPETPTEKYNRLHEQYQATLEEYRNSLAKFGLQLQKYASLSRNKK
ncbi:hypothetical protein GE061_018513 [Apolygus lucorum]|uniref:Uncharacterized protein n=1 Tax=Apolygus lucorum TaxID=248454 RepID=A0A8S9XE46_APOLU|nr:hypothetical protein GE061_018513 [Apolygus lucorum]